MTKQEVRAWIEETGVIAAVRVRSMEHALFAGEVLAHPLFGFAHLVFGDLNKSSHEVFSIQCTASRLRFACGGQRCLHQRVKSRDSFAGSAVPPDSAGRIWHVACHREHARGQDDGRSNKSRRGQRRCGKSLACSHSIR